MFGSKKSIGECLESGRSWVRELDEAVKVTEAEAEVKNEEVIKLTQECMDLEKTIEEGAKVASNFKKMLVMDTGE